MVVEQKQVCYIIGSNVYLFSSPHNKNGDYRRSSENWKGSVRLTYCCNTLYNHRLFWDMAQSARKNVTPRSGVTRNWMTVAELGDNHKKPGN